MPQGISDRLAPVHASTEHIEEETPGLRVLQCHVCAFEWCDCAKSGTLVACWSIRRGKWYWGLK